MLYLFSSDKTNFILIFSISLNGRTSKEEAKKRICEVYCNEDEEESIDDYSFSCQIDWKTARKVQREF